MKMDDLHHFKTELILRGYSSNTIKTYLGELRVFLNAIGPQNIERFDEEKLRSYLLHCHVDLKLSEATIHSRINALKFYFNNR
jgi:integrase/recombinase XerD